MHPLRALPSSPRYSPLATRSALRLSFSLAFVLLGVVTWVLLPRISLAQDNCNGQVTVTKTFEPPSVLSGDPVTVYINVHGCTSEPASPVPFSAVLVIDQSGSMGSMDANDRRIDAAEAFVDCAPQGSPMAVVSFDDNAHVRVAMTTNASALHTVLDSLRGNEGGSTNIYDALVEAHSLLSGSTYEKFIVLLTDGYDTSGHPDSHFVALLDEAVTEEFRYLTISLGSGTNTWMLRMFADDTGGQFAASPTANDLAQVFLDACTFAGSLAKTRNIVLMERLNHGGNATPGVQVVPGSFDSSDISLVGSPQIGSFETSGGIEVYMHTLGSGEVATIKFDVISDCLNPDSSQQSVMVEIDDPASVVEYTFGVDEASAPVPLKQFECVKPGDVSVEKSFDESEMELQITVESRYQPDPQGIVDNTLRNLMIVDQPSSYFQPILGTLVPNNDVRVFPGPIADVIVWNLGDLAPTETKSVSVNLQLRVCDSTYAPPIPVNATKYTGGLRGKVTWLRPDLTAGGEYLPFLPTNLLPPIPECAGRPDIALEPAETYWEFRSKTIFVNRGMRNKDETPAIWVDTQQSNGLWDGTIAGLASISGATSRPCGPSIPVADCFEVSGQGDVVDLGVPSSFHLYVRLGNSGDQSSVAQPSGVQLSIYNHSTATWDTLGIEQMPAISPNELQLVRFGLQSTNISPAAYVRPYKMTPVDALDALRDINPTLGGQIWQALQSNPTAYMQFRQMGLSVPTDLIALLPGNAGNTLSSALTNMGYGLAWGKPSVQIRVLASSLGGSDAHSNNNETREVILVR